MVFTCIAIDHCSSSLIKLSNYITDLDKLNLLGCYQDPNQAVDKINRLGQIDFLFVEIQLHRISGFDLYKMIKRKVKYLIVMCKHSQFAVDAIDIGARGYLLKPFSHFRFRSIIENVLTEEETEKLAHYIWIKSSPGKTTKKINTSDIVLIEAASNYINIQLTQNIETVYGTMSEFSEKLINIGSFLRVNRSYIVSERYITWVRGDKIKIYNEKIIKIGNTFKRDVMLHFKKKQGLEANFT